MMPASPEDERGLIAALVFEPVEAVPSCIHAGISPETFTVGSARAIFEQIVAAYSRGITLSAEVLWPKTDLEFAEFSRLTDNPPLSHAWRGHIVTLKALESRRRMLSAALELAEAAKSLPDDIPDRLARVLIAQTGRTAHRPWKKILEEVVSQSEAIARGEVPKDGGDLAWPWPDCDRVFQKLRRKELVIVAARPSVGKSSLMRSVALHAAHRGHNVLIESLEDSAENIALGMAATSSGVCKTGFPHAHPLDQKGFISALRALALPNLHVYDQDRAIGEIIARAKAHHATTPLDLVCIDYLGQIMECRDGTSTSNKASAIGNVTKALKDLATDLNCVVICLAQFNRESVKEGREPRLSDLKDSGDIEQDCDRAVFIHRPDTDPISKRTQSDSDIITDTPRFFQNLIQAKGRNVGTGIVSMYFNRAITRFNQIQR